MLRWLHIAPLLLAACTPGVKLNTMSNPPAPKPLECELRVYELDDIVVRKHEVVGDIYVRDTGFTAFRCGKQAVRGLVRGSACTAGADAVEIYQESHPSFDSSCYQVKARFLRFTD